MNISAEYVCMELKSTNFFVVTDIDIVASV